MTHKLSCMQGFPPHNYVRESMDSRRTSGDRRQLHVRKKGERHPNATRTPPEHMFFYSQSGHGLRHVAATGPPKSPRMFFSNQNGPPQCTPNLAEETHAFCIVRVCGCSVVSLMSTFDSKTHVLSHFMGRMSTLHSKNHMFYASLSPHGALLNTFDHFRPILIPR